MDDPPGPFVPSYPPRRRHRLSTLETVAALRRNVLEMWPQAAYESELLEGRLLGRRHFLINAPALIRRILVDNFANYHRPAPTLRILRPIIGDGLLLSEGATWRQQRDIIAPAFANRLVPVLARHVASATSDALAGLAAAADRPVPMLAKMQELALEIAARSMFSLEMRRHGPALRAMIERYRPRLGQPGLLDVVLPRVIPTPRDLARNRFRAGWVGLMDAVIAAREDAEPTASPRDLFDLLQRARDPATGAGFTQPQLRDQVATMIVAGHETTALTLFWAVLVLASVPQLQIRVAEEASGVDLGPDAAGDALDRLPFTRAVVSETLRLYPPAFIIARQAVAADRCGTIDIPKGALVMIVPWILHRHAHRWDEPDAFRPERFLAGSPPPRFGYLPFGAGPRVCVGAQFGMAEAVLVLAALVRQFELSLADRRPVMPAAVVSMQPNYAVPFRLRLRRPLARTGSGT